MGIKKHKVLIFIIPVTGNQRFRRDFLMTDKTHKLKTTLISAKFFKITETHEYKEKSKQPHKAKMAKNEKNKEKIDFLLRRKCEKVWTLGRNLCDAKKTAEN